MMITIHIPQKNIDSLEKKLDSTLHVIKDNMKVIVIATNKGEARENVRHHEIIDHEDTSHLKTLELEYRRIASIKKTNHDYIKTLISINDELRSINRFFQH